VLHRLHRSHSQGFERLKLGLQIRIFLNAFGMELEVQPLLETRLLYAGDFTGPRPKSQSVESMQDLLVFRNLLLEEFRLALGLVGLFRRLGECQPRQNQNGG
jgi:hypothetical protein